MVKKFEKEAGKTVRTRKVPAVMWQAYSQDELHEKGVYTDTQVKSWLGTVSVR